MDASASPARPLATSYTGAQTPGPSIYEQIADRLVSNGWGVFTPSFEPQFLTALLSQASQSEGRSAGLGRGSKQRSDTFMRRDKIAWIEGQSPAEEAWLSWIAGLQLYLNRNLMTGLASFESHFARYHPGDFYERHLDAFSGPRNRILSVVLYLNTDWSPADGGELIIYGKGDSILAVHPPLLGTLAIFFSETFPHEVRTTNKTRSSIAGWFSVAQTLPLFSDIQS